MRGPGLGGRAAGGGPAGSIQGPLPGCQRGIRLRETDVKRCCVFSSPASYQISLLFPRRSLLRPSLSSSSPPFAGSFPSSLVPTWPPPPPQAPARRLPLCQLLSLLHTQAWSRPLLPSCWPRQRWLFSREASNLQPRPSRLHHWVSVWRTRDTRPRGHTGGHGDYYAVVSSRSFVVVLVCYSRLCSRE